jgi:sugar lactone lactonase YvrE
MKFVHKIARPSSRSLCFVFVALSYFAVTTAEARITSFVLGASVLLVGPPAGSNSVVLSVTPAEATWTATPGATWLHLSPANQSGAGSANVVFSFDANPGTTRDGTLTIADQTLTVTQGGSTYVPAGTVTVLASAGLLYPAGLAVDGAGNVYIADTYNDAIKEWSPSNNAVNTLISSGLSFPFGVAVDGAGNVDIADTYDGAIKQWPQGATNVTTLASSGVALPFGIAVDNSGNLYVADAESNAIDEWSSGDGALTTLPLSDLERSFGVAVDSAGNVYAADTYHDAVKEWSRSAGIESALVSSGLDRPCGVAVDGGGNVYIADTDHNAIDKWTAASGVLTTLSSSGLNQPFGVAVDGSGNVYIADSFNDAIKELPYSFVDPTPKLEGVAAGSDALPVALPMTANLTGPFAPTTDQSWLTITGVTNGVVSFSFTANAVGSNRTAHIILLGQPVSVTQSAPTFVLGATNLLEGPIAGSDSIVLAVKPNAGSWTATTNVAWLHLTPASQSGTGSANVIFSFDANPGATRVGTLTLAGSTVTVTQAGSTYAQVQTVTTLISAGLNYADGVAVDASGNVYVVDNGDNAVKEWMAANNTVNTVVSSGLSKPFGLAVDAVGDLYIGEYGQNAVGEWNARTRTLSTLVSSGLSQPFGVAVDIASNVYVADTGSGEIEEWTTNHALVTLVFTGLYHPDGVAVDVAGNVYIADTGNQAIKEWLAANGNVNEVVSGASGIGQPVGVAVDGGGNAYIAGPSNGSVYKWSPANNTVTTLISSGLDLDYCVAVDGTRDVYIADTYHNAVKELPYAFVNAAPTLEGAAAGSDSLPAVLPTTINLRPPFAPVSRATWLTITGVSNGLVNFSFTANIGPLSRTGAINIMGQTNILVTQAGVTTTLAQSPIPLSANLSGKMLGNGSFQFAFTNSQGSSFTLVSSADMSLPLSNWTVVGAFSNMAPGEFQYTTPPGSNAPRRFYRVRSP